VLFRHLACSAPRTQPTKWLRTLPYGCPRVLGRMHSNIRFYKQISRRVDDYVCLTPESEHSGRSRFRHRTLDYAKQGGYPFHTLDHPQIQETLGGSRAFFHRSTEILWNRDKNIP
jgi:hypothetical protein